MHILTVAWLLAVLAACGGEPPCDYGTRTYHLVTHELSGDCGEQGESLQTPSGPPAGCVVVGPIPATGACAMGRVQRCTDADGTVTARLTVHRNDDYETWSGLSDVTLTDTHGALVCRSLYEVTLIPQ